MAGLPATKTPSPDVQDLTRTDTPRAHVVRALLYKGHEPRAIARAMAKGNKRKFKLIETQAYRIIGTDKQIQQRIGERAHGLLIAGVPAATAALARRAAKGNPQAIKLLFEASGFHNPKVQHEHSGDIKIELSLPRPPAQEPVDAEVVED